MNENKITLDFIKHNKEISTLITAANRCLGYLGYTDHGQRHVGYVSATTQKLLLKLGFDQRIAELGAIAGWMHDIGNCINRKNHAITGGNIAYTVLQKLGMDIEEIALIVAAIGSHDEEYGDPVGEISAALILADKADTHRSRVRQGKVVDIAHSIHDRVNMSVKNNFLVVDTQNRIIKLGIIMDNISAPMEYLQIYMSRMLLCERAANFLGYTFDLMINNMVINHNTKEAAGLDINLKYTETIIKED